MHVATATDTTVFKRLVLPVIRLPNVGGEARARVLHQSPQKYGLGIPTCRKDKDEDAHMSQLNR